MTDLISDIFTTMGFVHFISWLLILLELVYVIYAFIVVREVALMNKSFKTEVAPLFSLIALAHLVAAVVVTIASIITVL
jgi:hypothetical protein